ncbi:hypothetical protein EKO23_01885 [Nocardioides guangzhouensis]|uniref:Uncharacterized protein n=1 Tax=Nocardioides guangzhouensis TaxID=2497878 RepID=A0A4Q4ZL51_9ACTN|nr:hypothetical protein [Nocardioides guangzhouensis]RYP88665.1 hypothetical protein EKO23_01885 [Nocardioides guangzhouensis]
MDQIDVDFCFYDDPDFVSDADRDSLRLRTWHQQLWSKSVSGGSRIVWALEPGTSCLVHDGVRVSSDTIATTHANYRRLGVAGLWESLTEGERRAYDRAFYTIGGFVIFPTRPQSLNQRRGTSRNIADRFDLTLECIRQHYLGQDGSPLADVLRQDARYFGLFGSGADGFSEFVEFFHLQDLVSGGSVRWLDGSTERQWSFERPPLPQTLDAYRRYLANVASFVAARNDRIRNWCNARNQVVPAE